MEHFGIEETHFGIEFGGFWIFRGVTDDEESGCFWGWGERVVEEGEVDMKVCEFGDLKTKMRI